MLNIFFSSWVVRSENKIWGTNATKIMWRKFYSMMIGLIRDLPLLMFQSFTIAIIIITFIKAYALSITQQTLTIQITLWKQNTSNSLKLFTQITHEIDVAPTCICENECCPMERCELKPYSMSPLSKSCWLLSDSSSAVQKRNVKNNLNFQLFAYRIGNFWFWLFTWKFKWIIDHFACVFFFCQNLKKKTLNYCVFKLIRMVSASLDWK